MRTGHLLSLVALFMLSLAISGCDNGDPTTTPSSHNEEVETADHHGHDHGHDHDHDHDHAHDGDDIDPNLIATNLAKLTEEDRGLAEKQKICLVGGEALGSMGPPEKVDVDGTPIFICCKSCEREILNNKEKYLQLVNALQDIEEGVDALEDALSGESSEDDEDNDTGDSTQ
ncbi:MAG: hypothetical protein VYB09_06415 [Planctomycetota bacterium]|nr:hypothetical protein [Planctomycetota bacterium]